MPYITPKLREKFVAFLSQEIGPENLPDNCGELNYLITEFIHSYIKRRGLKYQTLNEVIGVLECAKLELYRQVAAPYENKKKIENGSISELDGKTLEDVR